MTSTPEQLSKDELVELIQELAIEARDRFGCLTIFSWCDVHREGVIFPSGVVPDVMESPFSPEELVTCQGFHCATAPGSDASLVTLCKTMRQAATAGASLLAITETMAEAVGVTKHEMGDRLRDLCVEIANRDSRRIRIEPNDQ